MGTLHARNATANARVQLALIADQHAPSAKRLAAETGAEIGTVDTMLDDPTIAGIIVVSSTDAHLDHARAALTVGKAVFCEKPRDLSRSEERRVGKERVSTCRSRRSPHH